MIRMITGPELRNRILARCFDRADGPGYVSYRYEYEDRHYAPEYAGELLRVRAYFMSTSPEKLRRLQASIAELPGCIETVLIEKNNQGLRPMVEARFDRRVAVEL